ncbi:hypothetical protein SAMN04487928_1248 [Butyrivibrio proteoclasticus]|uniref:Uncharacterized protein n=1 Tax=Butyrivibrio proteoclasticus TaxID=43305 RepID=A0A1I5WNS7_9FIRM|nr:sigma-70 family RNA polymerase sigma factor [Butyrivibrio proteoclasticus]SFQ21340.1 hypothetical protein SAMN04487928_1248 [Butyrivibrio proteoclasticus]
MNNIIVTSLSRVTATSTSLDANTTQEHRSFGASLATVKKIRRGVFKDGNNYVSFFKKDGYSFIRYNNTCCEVSESLFRELEKIYENQSYTSFSRTKNGDEQEKQDQITSKKTTPKEKNPNIQPQIVIGIDDSMQKEFVENHFINPEDEILLYELRDSIGKFRETLDTKELLIFDCLIIKGISLAGYQKIAGCSSSTASYRKAKIYEKMKCYFTKLV